MKYFWPYLFSCCAALFFSLTATSQDSLLKKKDSVSKRDRLSDTARMRRGGNMASFFSDSAKLTTSDFQLQIEKTYVVLSSVKNESDLGLPFDLLKEKLAGSDSILAVLKENVLHNAGALSLRNLQVFKTLLQNMQTDFARHRKFLDSSEKKLADLRSKMRGLMADTVLRQLLRDSAMRQQFAQELATMREVWRSGRTTLRESMAEVDRLQTRTSSNAITANHLLEKVNSLYTTTGQRIFGKEFNYLWEKDNDNLSQSARLSFKKAYQGERKALKYYFKDSGFKRLFLLLIGIVFFVWVYRNVRALKRLKAWERVRNNAYFEYLPASFVLAAFVATLSIAPFFDLYAPSAYIESVQFLLLIFLTVFCWKKWPRRLFAYWIVMVVLYLCFALSHHLVNPSFWQRCGFIGLNLLSILFGMLFLSRVKQQLPLRGFLRFVIILHNGMNVLAIGCNIAGRFSLAQILGSTAIFAFTHAIGLALFFKFCTEAFLLQIITSRTRNGVNSELDYKKALLSFGRPVKILVILLWLIVFAINLNVYTFLFNGVLTFLSTPRHIGSASFTFSGVLLFFVIIWIAHLLQKYVGYFFGDTGTDDDVPDKGQRSRLLITRLILLCLGYLLAVAASGVPVDRITIVLGALGVGIGLGLQNIVNNFVSGIILIFDRPLQIGDVVEISDNSERIHTGRVREIGLRSSTLLTQEGAEIIIPNGDILSQQIVNWTLTNNQQRLEMELCVSGSSDMEVIGSLLKKAVLSSAQVVESREPQVLFTRVLDNGFELKLFFWSKDVLKSAMVRSEVLLLLHQQLAAHNIQLC